MNKNILIIPPSKNEIRCGKPCNKYLTNYFSALEDIATLEFYTCARLHMFGVWLYNKGPARVCSKVARVWD